MTPLQTPNSETKLQLLCRENKGTQGGQYNRFQKTLKAQSTPGLWPQRSPKSQPRRVPNQAWAPPARLHAPAQPAHALAHLGAERICVPQPPCFMHITSHNHSARQGHTPWCLSALHLGAMRIPLPQQTYVCPKSNDVLAFGVGPRKFVPTNKHRFQAGSATSL